MKKVYCGDLVKLAFEFSDFEREGDTQAHVVLIREPDDPVTSFIQDVRNNRIVVYWPDLPIDSENYYGGAEAFLTGLGGSWESKWDKQKYYFEVIVGNKGKKSEAISIEKYEEKSTPNHKPCIDVGKYPSKISYWLGIFQEEKIDYDQPRDEFRNVSLGKFDIEMKKGQILITVNINYLPASNSRKILGKFTRNGGKDIKRISKAAETFWNNSFKKFCFHRVKCVRKDNCQCNRGCCKFQITLKVKLGRGHHDVVLHQPGRLKYAYCSVFRQQDIRANTGNFFINDCETIHAHEVGHFLGLPDEYKSGHVALPPTKFLDDDKTSIMNSGNRVYARHLHFIESWVNDKYKKELKLELMEKNK